MGPDAQSSSAQTPPNPIRALPGLRLSRVTCTADHALVGLFVIFRKHEDVWLKKLKEALGPLDPPFQLGVVGESGYLAPPGLPAEGAGGSAAVSGTAPALLPAWADLVPDTHRLAPQQPYQVYLIHHPSLAVAREALERINAGKEKVEPQILRTNDQAMLQVPEDPKSFFPAGPSFYKGWRLFRSMPAERCEPCITQVRRLQAHLGALRYMIGSSNFPYLPDFGADADKSGGDNDGKFDVRMMNAVASFQTDVLAGTPPFKVKAPLPHEALVKAGHEPQDVATLKARQGALAGVEESWAYLMGGPTAPPAPRPAAADGVVDEGTAKALEAWLDGGLRKPGAFLVHIADPRGWNRMWLRPEAARSWFLWNELTKALGFAEGICVNHTFRSAQVDIGHAGYGRSARSIHKTGLAMDLGLSSDFKRSAPAWPACYAREVDGDKIWWRLWGAATAPVPAPDAKPEVVQAAVEALAGKLEALEQQLQDHPLFAGEGPFLAMAVGQLVGSLRADGVAFFQSFYRGEVEVWDYDPFHPEGGTPLGKKSAPDFYKSHQQAPRAAALEQATKKLEHAASAVAKTAATRGVERAQQAVQDLNDPAGSPTQRTCFLDLTHLAELVGLTRIHAFRSGWQEVVRTTKVAALPAIAVMLKAARTSPKRSAAADAVVVRRKAGKLELKVSDLDDEFMLAWALGLSGLKKSARSVSVNLPQLTVPLTWGKSPIVKDDATVAAHLRTFADKQFHAIDPFTGQAAVQTGSAWADLIDGAAAKLEALVLVKQQEAPPAGGKPAKVPSKAPAPEKRLLILQPIFQKQFEPPAAGDALTAIAFVPGDVADVPAPGQPIGMEWWHYQRSDLLGSGKSRRKWGTLLMELGWTREGLSDQISAVLHHRRGVGYPEVELDTGAF
jgi:hypothetical protein